jgi:hypothetical protein
MQHPFLTPNALATRWAITPNTLSQWRWKGRGPQFLKIGRRVLYRLQDIELFENQKQRHNTPVRTPSTTWDQAQPQGY